LKDASRPWEGEACNADGTLKDASEMQWVNSPSQITPVQSGQKRGYDFEAVNDSDDSGDERPKAKRKVSIELRV
jgi:hypothetical protein